MIVLQEIARRFLNKPRILEMPGNHRYQPKSLQPYFGHDNQAVFQIEVEWALLNVLVALEVIPTQVASLLTDELYGKLKRRITTSLQDEIERAITKHDIRALVMAIRYFIQMSHRNLAIILTSWLHIPATSYDIIENARIIAYKRAFTEVSFPTLLEVIESLKEKVAEYAEVVQIGRTHGQHAEPITVGFWLATVLSRLIDIAQHLVDRENELVGKFSGPVGAYNAQVALGFERQTQQVFKLTFEEKVLADLRLSPTPISTQILPPEPLARFLFELTLLSSALGQLSRDCRQLQRTEIAEIVEPFEGTQDGSSAMPHKRNPINWEGTEGISAIVRNEFHKVLETLVSEHQRDATGMCIMRELPGIVVFTQHQLETVKRIIPRISVDIAALQHNFNLNKKVILSEAVYIALVMAGYQGDAHGLVNHTLVPRSQASGRYLIDELIALAETSPEVKRVVANIPSDKIQLMRNPEAFTGKAEKKALEIVGKADAFLKKYER